MKEGTEVHAGKKIREEYKYGHRVWSLEWESGKQRHKGKEWKMWIDAWIKEKKRVSERERKKTQIEFARILFTLSHRKLHILLEATFVITVDRKTVYRVSNGTLQLYRMFHTRYANFQGVRLPSVTSPWPF
jgi:hypothetical protein